MLHDWNSGKVPFYTLPPSDPDSMVLDSEAQIVDSLAAQFDVNDADAKVRKAASREACRMHRWTEAGMTSRRRRSG